MTVQMRQLSHYEDNGLIPRQEACLVIFAGGWLKRWAIFVSTVAPC